MRVELLSLQGIKKTHHEVPILSGMYLDAFCGQIQCVEFQSSLEKECLYSILSGKSLPDQGRVYIRGKCYTAKRSGHALYQLQSPMCPSASLQTDWRSLPHELNAEVFCSNHNFVSISTLSVAENLFLRNRVCYRGPFRIPKLQAQKALEYLDSYAVRHIDVNKPMGELNMLDQSIVQLLMIVQYGIKLIVLNDLIEKLSQNDLEILGVLLKRLKNERFGFLCLCNSPNSLFCVADRLTKVQGGQTIRITEDTKEIREEYMRWRAPYQSTSQLAPLCAPVILEGKNLRLPPLVKPFSFQLHEGEVVGINCRDFYKGYCLAEVLTGTAPRKPILKYRGNDIKISSKGAAVRRRIALIPPLAENAIFPNMNVEQNISIMMEDGSIYPFGLLKKRLETYAVRNALALWDEADILTYYKNHSLENLSARHQLIICLSRCIAAHISVFVLLNPQINFSVADIGFLNKYITILQKRHCSVIIISVDIDLFKNVCNTVVTAE